MPSCNAICNFNWRVAHSHTAYDKKIALAHVFDTKLERLL